MRVKLLQRDKVVDSSDCIERLDFSVLSRRADWRVIVDFGDGDETIAMVNWTDGIGYVVNTRGEDDRGLVDCHSHIVPTVRCRLIRLFQQDSLPGRMIVVTPVLG
jgi:hypothetical protein